jgi:hypothetical protein
MATNLDLIYERWKASLRDKDRSKGFVDSNFDELFDALKGAGATFDEGHAILPSAIKAHQPSIGLAKNTWKLLKNSTKNSDLTEKEFIDQWNKDIADRGTNSFYNAFSLPNEKDDDGEPKVFGSMSAKEYKLQRKNASSYPILDTEELERRLLSDAYNPADDILGDKDKNGKSN